MPGNSRCGLRHQQQQLSLPPPLEEVRANVHNCFPQLQRTCACAGSYFALATPPPTGRCLTTATAASATGRSLPSSATAISSGPRTRTGQPTVATTFDELPVGGRSGGGNGRSSLGRYRYVVEGSGDIDDVNGVNYEFFGAGPPPPPPSSQHSSVVQSVTAAAVIPSSSSSSRIRRNRSSDDAEEAAAVAHLDGEFIVHVVQQAAATATTRPLLRGYRAHFRFGGNDDMPSSLHDNEEWRGADGGDYVSDAVFRRHFTYERLLALHNRSVRSEEERRRGEEGGAISNVGRRRCRSDLRICAAARWSSRRCAFGRNPLQHLPRGLCCCCMPQPLFRSHN